MFSLFNSAVGFVENQPTKTLIVKNLSFSVTHESLQELFKGSTRIGLPKHPDTGKIKG